MRACLCLLLSLPFLAFPLPDQDVGPIGIVRGDLMVWPGSVATGDLSVQTAERRIYTCHFDEKTYFERDNQRISVGATRVGDRLEIVSDRTPGSPLCYARTVHVMAEPPLKPLPGARSRLRSSRSPTELFAPRGNLTFAGIVLRLDREASPETLLIRTRNDGHKTILLRHDTRYLGGGMLLDSASLDVNTRVFVRAGRNMEEQIEAYQVVWGEIFEPK